MIKIKPVVNIIDPCSSHMDGCSCDDPREYEVEFKLVGKKFVNYDKCEKYIKQFDNLFLKQ